MVGKLEAEFMLQHLENDYFSLDDGYVSLLTLNLVQQ